MELFEESTVFPGTSLAETVLASSPPCPSVHFPEEHQFRFSVLHWERERCSEARSCVHRPFELVYSSLAMVAQPINPTRPMSSPWLARQPRQKSARTFCDFLAKQKPTLTPGLRGSGGGPHCPSVPLSLWGEASNRCAS